MSSIVIEIRHEKQEGLAKLVTVNSMDEDHFRERHGNSGRPGSILWSTGETYRS